jgi:hypothetical protein
VHVKEEYGEICRETVTVHDIKALKNAVKYP